MSEKVKWSTEDSSVLDITENGNDAIITALSIGVTTITADITTDKGSRDISIMISTRTPLSANGYANANTQMRRAANANSSISFEINKNEILEIAGENGKYYWVRYSDSSGFVPKSKVTVVADKVVLAEKYIALKPSEQKKLEATVEPDLYEEDPTWKSNNTDVATVNTKGQVTAHKEGTAKITASAEGIDGNINGSCIVSVWTAVENVAAITTKNTSAKKGASADAETATALTTGTAVILQGQCGSYYYVKQEDGTFAFVEKSALRIPVSDLTLSAGNIVLRAGESHQLKATIRPELATNKKIAWSGQTDSITVNDSGKVSAKKEGSTKIIASAEGVNGKIEAVSIVSVWSSLVEMKAVVLEAGNSRIGAMKDAANGALLTKGQSVTIIGACGDYYYVKLSDASRVFVKKSLLEIPVTKLALNTKEITIGLGKTYQLSVKVTPELATDKSVIWSSKNKTVAKVDDKGKVTGIKEGTAEIQVKSKDGTVVDVCKVKVQKAVGQEAAAPFFKLGKTERFANKAILNFNIHKGKKTNVKIQAHKFKKTTISKKSGNEIYHYTLHPGKAITAKEGTNSITISNLEPNKNYSGKIKVTYRENNKNRTKWYEFKFKTKKDKVKVRVQERRIILLVRNYSRRKAVGNE